MADPISIANVSGFVGDRISAARERVDAHQQAKGLGEFVRARHVDVPEELVGP